MWAIFEIALILAVVLVSITEFFYPLLTEKPLFGSFRKSVKKEIKKSEEASLNDEILKAKEKVKDIKEVQKNVNDKLKTAEELKKEADDLLK